MRKIAQVVASRRKAKIARVQAACVLGLCFSAALQAAPSLATPPALENRLDPGDMEDAEQFAMIIGRFEAHSAACGVASREAKLTAKSKAAVERRFRSVGLSGADALAAIDKARRAEPLSKRPSACGSFRQEELIVTNAIAKEQDPDWRSSEPLVQ